MSDGFYLADEKSLDVKGVLVENKGVLYFRLEKANYDNKATKDHVKGYPQLFKAFTDANPDHKLPESWGDVEDFGLKIGEIKHTPVVVESPQVPVTPVA